VYFPRRNPFFFSVSGSLTPLPVLLHPPSFFSSVIPQARLLSEPRPFPPAPFQFCRYSSFFLYPIPFPRALPIGLSPLNQGLHLFRFAQGFFFSFFFPCSFLPWSDLDTACMFAPSPNLSESASSLLVFLRRGQPDKASCRCIEDPPLRRFRSPAFSH